MQLKYLPQIKSPKDLKELDNNSLHRLCDELRYYTVNTITQIGGHLAPTLGVIELTTALHYIYNTPDDKLVWDVGHQAYAHKLLTGRFDEFPSIRQYGGLSGFLKRKGFSYNELVNVSDNYKQLIKGECKRTSNNRKIYTLKQLYLLEK